MLIRLLLVASAAALGVATLSGGPAYGDPGGGVVCPPVAGPCSVSAGSPGSPGEESSDAGGSPRVRPAGSRPSPCTNVAEGRPVPCQDPTFGNWDQAQQCYLRRADPQPPRSDPVWQDTPAGGAVFDSTCLGGSVGWTVRAGVGSGPAAVPPPVPAVLAERAVRRLPLAGPDIGMAPPRGSTGLVGLPVWMWTGVSPGTWGPISATASVPGLSVTATGRAVRVVWDMGDGHTVTCTGPGTVYQPRFGDRMSPTCGYRYTRSSARTPGGVYRVTATTTWRVSWSGGGASGVLSVARASQTTARVGELQVLIDG